MRIITLDNGTRINADSVASYAPARDGLTTITYTGGHTETVPTDCAVLDRAFAATGALSDSDRRVLEMISRKMEELKGAIMRMPSSLHVRY